MTGAGAPHETDDPALPDAVAGLLHLLKLSRVHNLYKGPTVPFKTIKPKLISNLGGMNHFKF